MAGRTPRVPHQASRMAARVVSRVGGRVVAGRAAVVHPGEDALELPVPRYVTVAPSMYEIEGGHAGAPVLR